ncbi:MAG: antitoxin component YwqK of YwqJK toxin-antitoxin module [Cognaticolwellia sp.]|jgi:antitoxin component YwqK of YwqJK toxin-antitoxin module
MKLLSTLFFIITLTTLQAQNTVEVIKKSFSDGLPEIVNFYDGDKTEANLVHIVHYNRDGKTVYNANYKNGLQHGKTLYYDSYNLWLTKALNYTNDELDGTQIGYFNGQDKRFDFFYTNGKLDGTQREWHSNGKQKSEWQLKNGVLDGVQKLWNSYEIESEDIVFEKGILAENKYYSNEKLSKKLIYKTEVTDKDFIIDYDKKLIEELLFQENGRLQKQTMFDELKTVIHYYENGNKKAKEQFKEYSKVGEWSFWYENGNKSEVKIYENNILNGAYSAWYENGKLKEQGEYTGKRKSGQWNFWNENGKRSAEGGFVDNKKTGNWTYWKANGQQEKFGAYKKGREMGIWQYWNDKEQITEEQTFDYGNQKKWKVFFYGKNGKVTESGFLDIKGNKTEAWEYWFENGDKKRAEVYKPGPYHNGRPIVKYFKEWYPNGELKRKGDDKKFVEYTYANKKIVTEKHFIQHKDNRRYEYYEDGEIKKKLAFQRNEGGDMITRKVIENMLIQEIYYYENRNKKSSIQYCENCKIVPAEALEKLNNSIGKICKTCPAYTKAYRNLEEPVYNLRHGEFEEWYENGQLKVKGFYINNCLKGNVEEYYPTGELMFSIVISEHPYKDKLEASAACMPLVVGGIFYNEKGKEYPYMQSWTQRSKSKAAKKEDYTLLEEEEDKPRKIITIEAESYFFQHVLER